MVKAKKKEEKEEPQPPSPKVPGPPTENVWSFGVNDHCQDVSEQALKLFVPTQNFKVDFSALCDLMGVVAHPGLAAPKKPAGEVPECQSLAVQSMLMDLASMRVMRHVLTTAAQLQSLRLSSCCLDVEMLQLLHAGLADVNGQSTVHTLHIDWNPVELPLGAEAVAALPAEGALEALDELERKRLKKQAERELRAFGAQLQACIAADLDTALREVAEIADPKYTATAMLKPLDMGSFTEAVKAKIELSSEEVERVFKILDMPCFGSGDGRVTLERTRDVLREHCRPQSQQEEGKGRPKTGDPEAREEMKDPIGCAFASLVDGTSVLEAVSFRCCALGCVEAKALGRALRQSQHLRALNLWGNRICDRGAGALAEACEHYYGLEYLGLGRNFVTHVGLESFCKVLGVSRIDSKDRADPVLKHIKEHTKDRDKKLAKSPPVPKRDANGRERYAPEFYHIDKCEERRDPVTNQVYWVRTRNTTLKTLVLERNPVTDAETVRRLQPFGVGDLVLRGTPCVEALLKARAEKAKVEKEAAVASSPAPDAAEAKAGTPTSPPTSAGRQWAPALSPTGGWRLVLT